MKKQIKRQKRISRRRFMRAAVLGSLGFCTACAVDAWGLEPEWVDLSEQDLGLKNLPPEFAGKKLVHISDLHLSSTVSEEYLRRCIQRINRLNPDMVAMTGDYVTIDKKGAYKDTIIRLIGKLRAPLGVFACLGNHDYGVTGVWQKKSKELQHTLIHGMQARGVKVLRNSSEAITISESRLWMIGLGDLWARDLDIPTAFSGVKSEENRIVLGHNPDIIDHISDYSYDIMLSGHTHGGQVRLPFLRPPILPIKNRQYYAGMFNIAGKKLYVNRGLGRLGRMRFNCRPEITVFTLHNDIS